MNDRHNGRIFLLNYLLIFLAAPVLYVGVVQAALSRKLGASATVASLPASAFLFGQLAPLLVTWLVPRRRERDVVVWANAVTAALILTVLVTLVLPLPDSVRIGALILQGLLQGLSGSTSLVFMIQCLRRGTTPDGQKAALKQTYSAGPIAAVAGSLGAQYLLTSGRLPYPYDFALLYGVGALCAAAVALASRRFLLVPVAEEPSPPLGAYLAFSIREYGTSRPLVLLWIAYMLWNCTLAGISNLSLYTREAMGRSPEEFSGLIMAIRFGCKALGGLLLGWLALKSGLRTSVLATVLLVGAGMLWAWTVPGYPYLFAFGLLGAGELGGAYFPNCVAALSTLATSARNVSLITLATPAASFAPALHGMLTDRYGFPASFAFGLATAIAGALLVAQIPRETESAEPRQERAARPS